MTKVLIIGSSGFIGSNLSSYLSSKNYEVYSLVRKSSSLINFNKAMNYYKIVKQPKLIYCDLANIDELDRLFKNNKFDTVINSAAYGLYEEQQNIKIAEYINCTFCENLIYICHENSVKHLIHLGTGHEYGLHNEIIDENTPLNPVSLYGITKARGGETCIKIAEKIGIKLTYLRPFSIYGQFQSEKMFVPLILNSINHKIPIQLSPGEQLRDYLHIDDLVFAIDRVLRSKNHEKISIFNIAYGKSYSLVEIAEFAASVTNLDLSRLKWGYKDYRNNENMKIAVSNKKAKINLNWSPKIDIKSGLLSAYKNL